MAKPRYSRAYVEITNVCNRSCSFCPGTRREGRFMTMPEFAHIIASLDGITEYIYLHVMGEPLLHPELFEFIKYASARGFKCAVTTNGTRLFERGYELINSGVYKVNISVHSFEEGTREQLVEYIESCIDFADHASRAGVLTVLRLWNRGYDEGRNIDILAMLRQRFTEPWQSRGDRARLRHRLHLEYGDRFDWPDLSAESLGERVFCHGLGDHFGILADGTVVPCCLDREGAIALGNVYEEPLGRILTSPRAEKIRAGFQNKCAKEELCRRCGYARRFKV